MSEKQDKAENLRASHGYAVVLEVVVSETEHFERWRCLRRTVSWPFFRPMVDDKVLISERDRVVTSVQFDLDASQLIVQLDSFITKENYSSLCQSLAEDGWRAHIVDD